MPKNHHKAAMIAAYQGNPSRAARPAKLRRSRVPRREWSPNSQSAFRNRKSAILNACPQCPVCELWTTGTKPEPCSRFWGAHASLPRHSEATAGRVLCSASRRTPRMPVSRTLQLVSGHLPISRCAAAGSSRTAALSIFHCIVGLDAEIGRRNQAH